MNTKASDKISVAAQISSGRFLWLKYLILEEERFPKRAFRCRIN